MNSVLLLGAGSARDRRIVVDGRRDWLGQELVTLDLSPRHGCDVVHDLDVLPWPFADDAFCEVHAYEVLEHLGAGPGDYQGFFATFSEVWRILKPGGYLAATVPGWRSEWAMGDPGHRRVITPGSLVFLCQQQYEAQVGKTSMSDYRDVYRADFDPVALRDDVEAEELSFVLRAVKPSRWKP